MITAGRLLRASFGFFNDGDPLPDRKVISLKSGHPVVVYRCQCGREQAAECADYQNGGLSESAARSIGWTYSEDPCVNWACPFCSNNAEKLLEVFASPLPK